MNRDAVGLGEPGGHGHHAVGSSVLVLVHHGVDCAGVSRADEQGPARAQRHRPRVLDAISEQRNPEARGQLDALELHSTRAHGLAGDFRLPLRPAPHDCRGGKKQREPRQILI